MWSIVSVPLNSNPCFFSIHEPPHCIIWWCSLSFRSFPGQTPSRGFRKGMERVSCPGTWELWWAGCQNSSSGDLSVPHFGLSGAHIQPMALPEGCSEALVLQRSAQPVVSQPQVLKLRRRLSTQVLQISHSIAAELQNLSKTERTRNTLCNELFLTFPQALQLALCFQMGPPSQSCHHKELLAYLQSPGQVGWGYPADVVGTEDELLQLL